MAGYPIEEIHWERGNLFTTHMVGNMYVHCHAHTHKTLFIYLYIFDCQILCGKCILNYANILDYEFIFWRDKFS